MFKSKQSIHEDTEGPKINFFSYWLFKNFLRSSVLIILEYFKLKHDLSFYCSYIKVRNPEVSNLNKITSFNIMYKDIGWLNISMIDPLTMYLD